MGGGAALVIGLGLAIGAAVLTRRTKLAKWLALGLLVVVVIEGQAMIDRYKPYLPPTAVAHHYERTGNAGTGAMGITNQGP